MIYTFIFGAPVHNRDQHIGKLVRVVVNNGIANQVTVDPGLLGLERVVPISDIQEATADHIQLDITDDDWKAYAAFKVQQSLGGAMHDEPDSAVVGPTPVLSSDIRDTSHPTDATGARETDLTVSANSVVLSTSTAVVNDDATGVQHKLKGLVVDTGRPQQFLLEDGSTVSFEQVSLLDEQRIHIRNASQDVLTQSDRTV